jgi:PHP family Zn ribbon phosphoesterase
MVASSDSHYLDEIGRAFTDVYALEPTFEELALAFASEEGRSVTPVWRDTDA